MGIVFRKCNVAHLDELVRISKTTFVDAFEKGNKPEDFRTYIEDAFDKSTIERQLNNKDSKFYFVYKEEHLAGYFKLNESETQTEFKTEHSIELERIYILKKFQGQQLGAYILREVQNMGILGNKKFIWLGVWQKNKRAIRFYEKHGFVKFGTHPYFIGQDKQTDWLMRLEL